VNLSLVESVFHDNFKHRGELGASVSIWQHGKEILSLHGGFADRKQEHAWTESTKVLVWSATKGTASACVNHLLEQHGIPLSTPVSAYWPEFAQGGKEMISFGQVLSHQAGLPALDFEVPVQDHPSVAAALTAQIPFWVVGEGHGYHPRTFGSLLDEIVRRLAGVPLGQYWRKYFAEPMGLDFWIGLPPEQVAEPASIFPAKISPQNRNPDPVDDEFYKALASPNSLTARAFGSPKGLGSVASMNTPEARMSSLPAFGGIGTARALGKFYAMLANGGEIDGTRYFASTTPMSTPLTMGEDYVLLRETVFTAGYMRDPLDFSGKKLRKLFGPSLRAFGQPGAGGSHAFADPETGISFAYVMNQMEPGVLPNSKSLLMVEALYS
jgi:CubicO group peptidase (beta-lactamase class C family)